MARKQTVRDIMNQTLAYSDESTIVRDVAQMMVNHDCGEIPVLDYSGAPIGIITARDICCRIIARGRAPDELTAADCMSWPCVTIDEDAPVEECRRLLEEHHIRRVLVVDDAGLCCGLVGEPALKSALELENEIEGEAVESAKRTISTTIPARFGDKRGKPPARHAWKW